MSADIDSIIYHQALAELGRSARAFSHAIKDAAIAAERLRADDLMTMRVFEDCRNALLDAFARAPGMIQLFTGKAA